MLLAALLVAAGPGSVFGQEPASVEIGPLVGDTVGRESEALAFGVQVENPDLVPLFYRWDFGDGSGGLSGRNLSAVNHRFDKDTTYTVSLVVSGGAATGRRELDVEIRNAAPRIVLFDGRTDLLLDVPVDYRGEAHDVREDSITYVWSYGDGTPPDSGLDLRSVRHRYTREGEFAFQLRVRDEDGDGSDRSAEVTVRPGFRLRIRGDIEADAEGPTTPVRAGYYLSPLDPGRACGVSVGMYDDDARVLAILQTGPGDLWTERSHRVVPPEEWSHRPAPSTAEIQILSGDQEIYDYMKGLLLDPERGPGGLGGALASSWDDLLKKGLESLASSLLGRLNPFGGGGSSVDATGFESIGGTVELAPIVKGRITGRIGSAAFEDIHDGDDRDLRATARGRFTFELAPEDWRMLEAQCAPAPFTVETHTPAVEEEGVDWELPGIAVEFTRPYDAGTVDEKTFRVGYLDGSGDFRPMDGRRVRAQADRAVYFAPAEPLRDGVAYRVRLRGGDGGILGRDGTPMEEDYEWRFLTRVNLVTDPGEGGSR